MSADEVLGARVPAGIAGSLAAPVAVADHALMGDLCAAIRMVWRRETSANADVRASVEYGQLAKMANQD